MKSKVLLCLALILGGGLTGCRTVQNHPAGLPIRYQNAEYDLAFYLPEDWKGYSVLRDEWEGITYRPEKDADVVLARGPLIILRSPLWKANDLYQDIPIYIFTRQQWDDDKSGEFSAEGAGGVLEGLWHNDKYVYSMHSRYNVADDVNGQDEVRDIVRKNCAAHPEPHLHDI